MKGKPKPKRKGNPKGKSKPPTPKRAEPVDKPWHDNADEYIKSLLAKATLEELSALEYVIQDRSALDPRRGRNRITWHIVTTQIAREQVKRDPFQT